MRNAICLTLLIGTIFFKGIFAHAEGDASEYQFNEAGKVKPEFDKSINFVAPTDDEKKKKLDLIGDASNQKYYSSTLDYPKSDILFSYNPGVDGFTNTLSSTRTYSYGGTNLTGFSGAYVYNPSIENYATLELNYENISIPEFRDTGAGLLVNASNAQVLDVLAAFNWCQVYESTYHRLCPGIELNYDSFPTLSFPQTSNSDISLQSVHDMTIGLNLGYNHKLVKSVRLITKISYNYGLDVGQSSVLGTKNDQKFAGRVGVEGEWTDHFFWNLALGLDYRKATLQSSQDTWTIQALQYMMHFGLRYEFSN